MGFMFFEPLGEKTPLSIKTSNNLVSQILQEFVMLRYLKSPKIISAPKAIAPWIDQGKTYFNDAIQSDWRSGGLLYYYSFLNFAKAFLVAKKICTFKFLNTTSVYHGLSSKAQDITKLTDFEVSIYPPSDKQGHRNVFSSLYEGVTRQKWPFNKNVTIKLEDIADYCFDIATELQSLYKINNKIIGIQSLLRFSENAQWFEMIVPNWLVPTIKKNIAHWPLDEIPSNKMTKEDYHDWLLAYPKSINKNFRNLVLLRSSIIKMNPSNPGKSIVNEATSNLKDYAIPTIYEQADNPYWLFVPKIQLINKELHWHPLLSNYLIAFVLSTILRYQPQLLRSGSPNSFLAEAWCSQSALSTLRYFLMLFTSPPLRVETY